MKERVSKRKIEFNLQREYGREGHDTQTIVLE